MGVEFGDKTAIKFPTLPFCCVIAHPPYDHIKILAKIGAKGEPIATPST